MRIRAPYSCIALLLLPCGCGAGRAVEQPPKQVLEQFAKTLSGLEQAVDAAASASATDKEELSGDLRHRVGRLEDAVGELAHQTRDKPEAQAALNQISQTLADARRAAEGNLNLAKLREEVGKLKAQADELQRKL